MESMPGNEAAAISPEQIEDLSNLSETEIESAIQGAVAEVKQELGREFTKDNLTQVSETVFELIAKKYAVDLLSILNTSGKPGIEAERNRAGQFQEIFSMEKIDSIIEKQF